jgi:predicted  nucleic acid-binding Zn-ribbon protein
VRSLLTILVCFAWPGLAQDTAVPVQETTLQTLLNEVRALRLALERANQLGPKIQIGLARMRFQEERVQGITRQLDAAHNELSNIQNTQSGLAGKIKELESRISQGTDPTVRKQVEYDIESMKGEMERLNAREQQFRAREAELNVLLQNEQAKWNEINDQLVSF